MYYNNIEYDIGQKLGQIQDLYNKIGTMTYSNSSNNFEENVLNFDEAMFMQSEANFTI